MTKKRKSAKSSKIPKRIGGVKLPKELRKSGDRLIAKATSPEGQRTIAAGLAMAGAALARAKMPPPAPPSAQSGEGAASPVPPIPPIPPRQVNVAPDGMGTPMVDPAQIAEAVGQAATAFFDGLFGRRR